MPAPSPRISIASPTGQQWRIGHGRQEAVVCEVGATLRAYSVGPTTVLDGFGTDEWSHSGRGQVLAPWPNRLADGRYEYNGVRAQAALDEPERRNAIHGLVRWMPWTLQTRHQNQLSLRLQLHPSPGYPFSLLLEIEYHVGREGLTVTTRAQSLEEGPIPFGLGFHPYLSAGPGASAVDGAILHVPARHTLETDDRGLPTGTLTPVEGTDRDFTTARLWVRWCSIRPTPRWSATPTAWPGRAWRRPVAWAGPRCGWMRAFPISWSTRATRWARCSAAGTPSPLSR